MKEKRVKVPRRCFSDIAQRPCLNVIKVPRSQNIFLPFHLYCNLKTIAFSTMNSILVQDDLATDSSQLVRSI